MLFFRFSQMISLDSTFLRLVHSWWRSTLSQRLWWLRLQTLLSSKEWCHKSRLHRYLLCSKKYIGVKPQYAVHDYATETVVRLSGRHGPYHRGSIAYRGSSRELWSGTDWGSCCSFWRQLVWILALSHWERCAAMEYPDQWKETSAQVLGLLAINLLVPSSLEGMHKNCIVLNIQ